MMKIENGEKSIHDVALVGSRDEISFSSSQDYCIGMVDVVNSTGLIAGMGNSVMVRKFLSTFINAMAFIVRNFDGIVIKNVGDSLFFYFPETSDMGSRLAFKKVFECFAAMIDARPVINTRLYQAGLPAVSYRISADYGRVEVAHSRSSKQDDLFGPAVSLCAKMNPMAQENGIVIGDDLCAVVRALGLEGDGMNVTGCLSYSAGLKFSYPVHDVVSVSRDRSNPLRRRSGQESGDGQETGGGDVRLKNIMIVDDELDALRTFRSFLDENKYRVQTFSSGEEALRRIASVRPSYYDLIITDIRMAPVNGIELFARAARADPDAKVLFVSALDATQELVSIFPDVNGQNVLRKPVSREQFIRTVEALTS